MYIANLIANILKHNKSYKFNVHIINFDTIKVIYNLSIPNWVNDKEVLTQDNMSILYSRYISKESDNNVYNNYSVNKENVDSDYPFVGNKKWFRISKIYNIQELIDKDLLYYFSKESDKALAEIKSYILLQKIGDLSSKWEAVNANRHYISNKINYGVSKIKYNDLKETEPTYISIFLEDQPIDFNINKI